MVITSSAPVRVLIVDDMHSNRELISHALPSDEFQVTEAGDGVSALELVSTQAFDVVLLDIMMPGMDGLEVCEKLRSDPDNAQLPIIILTALGNPDDIAHGMEVGASDYLTKPFTVAELKARITSTVKHNA